jgi:hypothetical protein
VKVSRVPDIDEFLDPKSLTPQELYKLQSETWEQGAEYERERILKIIDDYRNKPTFGYSNLISLIKGGHK